jgi:crotonobetaine/carnitine-CoA ligase
VDRLKDAIRRRGENISSLEIEGEVITHPGVADAAAIGIPSELGDEEVFLAVVPKANVRLAEVELMEYLIPRVPHFMVPRYIQFFDALPRTPTNKVQKYVLKKEGVGPNTWDRERHGYVLKKTRLS